MRRGRGAGHARIVYPTDLVAVPPFPTWLQERIWSDLASGAEVEDVAAAITFPPRSNVVLNFASCMAFGNHYRVIAGDVEGGSQHLTATSLWWLCRVPAPVWETRSLSKPICLMSVFDGKYFNYSITQCL